MHGVDHGVERQRGRGDDQVVELRGEAGRVVDRVVGEHDQPLTGAPVEGPLGRAPGQEAVERVTRRRVHRADRL